MHPRWRIMWRRARQELTMTIFLNSVVFYGDIGKVPISIWKNLASHGIFWATSWPIKILPTDLRECWHLIHLITKSSNSLAMIQNSPIWLLTRRLTYLIAPVPWEPPTSKIWISNVCKNWKPKGERNWCLGRLRCNKHQEHLWIEHDKGGPADIINLKSQSSEQAQFLVSNHERKNGNNNWKIVKFIQLLIFLNFDLVRWQRTNVKPWWIKSK